MTDMEQGSVSGLPEGNVRLLWEVVKAQLGDYMEFVRKGERRWCW